MHWLITICCCVLMFSSVAEGPSVKQCAYIGQPAKFLYKIDSDYADLSLYRENATYIASWKGNNTEEDIISSYIGKIFMDKERNIWMFGVERKDNGSYYLQYGILQERQKIILIVMEKKQLNVCLNSLPNSAEKYFGNLMEEQVVVVQYIEKFLDDHPQYIKRHFGHLTGEQIGEEVRKWLADHPEYIKGSLGNLTVEQIGQKIRKLLDDYTEHIKEDHGSHGSLTNGLLISILVIVVLAIIIFIICWRRKKLCSEPKQSSKSHNKRKAVPTGGSGETTSMLSNPSETVQMETAQSNETNVGNVF